MFKHVLFGSFPLEYLGSNPFLQLPFVCCTLREANLSTLKGYVYPLQVQFYIYVKCKVTTSQLNRGQ